MRGGLVLTLLLCFLFNAVLAVLPIDSYEYDNVAASQAEIISVSGDIYVIAYRDSAGDGWVKTLSIGTNGNIVGSIIDSLEFDDTNCANPSIKHVSGDIYTVAYTGNDSDGWLVTFSIDSNGLISDSVIDRLEFDIVQGSNPHIKPVTGDYFAIAYAGSGSDGYVVTVAIDADGVISDTVVDSFEFDTLNGQYPRIFHVSGDYYFVAYSGNGNDGYLASFTIDSSGGIGSSVIDSLEFDIDYCVYPSIAQLSSNYYAVAYTGVDTDGYVITASVSDTGVISTSVIDSLEVDAIQGVTPRIIGIRDNYYVVAVDGSDNDGWLYTITITSAGTISDTVYDSYEFNAVQGQTPDLLLINGDVFAVVYSGDGSSDGYVATFDLNPVICGDASCQSGETYSSCPTDCCDSDCTSASDSVLHYACNGYNSCSILSGCDGKATNYLYCVDSNTYATCPVTQTDCSSGLYCNNGVCSSCSSVCDGSCTGANCYNTDPDCDATGSAALNCCGNNKCSSDESCSSCPNDCGQCQITLGVCGNSICEADYSETCSNCAQDCGVCAGEVCNPGNCNGVCGECKEFQCNGNSCDCEYISDCCGNRICESGESFSSCSSDCNPASINVMFISPSSGGTYMRGEVIPFVLNVTFDEGVRGFGANVTVVTPIGEKQLNYDPTVGVYRVNVTIPNNASVGNWVIDAAAKRGVTGASSRIISVSNEFVIAGSTDKLLYTKNERVLVSGSLKNARGEFISGSLRLIINNETVSLNVINGFFNSSYLTNVIDPSGLWNLVLLYNDSFNNTGSYGLSINVTDPSEGTYYSVLVTSPLRGLINRGDKVVITAQVSLGSTLINDAYVYALMPDGSKIELSGIDDGVYSNSVVISNDAPVGDWDLNVIASKDSFSGVSRVRMFLKIADIKLDILSPTKTSFSLGDDISIIIKASYPNGDPVLLPEINVNISGSNITLLNKGGGIYENVYSINNLSDFVISITVNDESNNLANDSVTISVSGTSLLYYVKSYPYVIWPLVSGFVVGFVLLFLKFFKLNSVKGLKVKECKITELKKCMQDEYFNKKSMSRERYNELIVKYDSELEMIKDKITRVKNK